MSPFGRQNQEIQCVESDFKKEVSELANTAAIEYGWRSGGRTGTKNQRC
jgi:hypothetical protein